MATVETKAGKEIGMSSVEVTDKAVKRERETGTIQVLKPAQYLIKYHRSG